MKSIICVFVSMFFFSVLSAQQPFVVPEVSSDQEKEILYNHVMAYLATGITFAKSKGVSPEEYGKYIGKQFKPYWSPEQGFPALANTTMFLLKGMHPNNEMQIVEQSERMICFKLKNVDALFLHGPAYGMTYKEMLECSKGVLSTIATHMDASFKHQTTDGGWYKVTLKAN